ncbi:MAG: 50S ribosomal protein L20 [Chlamydiae bacterium RIFCSPHIGHO2_12_FULL_44_59]|nr:MAG: 50S ribosomal protein L20 [Chlamydiae bacterium RIFCSPHIGHO2_01_FULL_44_39]OGN57671.1 MAG: 50S ribosomal protein L20 [Chlamydiae bacterium RIFCSPHIGHO2_02_FULL_45_9]OGN60219.1 MAG: 50S ribosomal protein L20 [Chlamydiae bacterium RIFCSPHIGHO2_12_FULL_44_59]OGN67128.1 MAG: 50S ribosomal protein L20 [Chlamydiae bacterium RIFCSPLOWO2_01_FULL_44_52]OGN67718.1 MAG: 50S ribosomal protein L20 [Chlamydiae bacterium RIFCSPLOWO2_02_FULL_45_22]OGN71421.1 MAG: 50S ribosomal protein L20 [Chlamydiae 
MVRVTNSVQARKRTKKLLKRCSGFYGDRKNHLRLSKDALMTALANNYKHRKLRKRDFRSLWITRIGVGAKINGLSYSRLIDGLKRVKCEINRKMLAELAIQDPAAFTVLAVKAKQGLAA